MTEWGKSKTGPDDITKIGDKTNWEDWECQHG